VLAAISDADAMLFPSLHDSAGWAAAEASAAGLPVVCLDIGGPPLLAGPNARVVAAGPRVVADLAAALARSLDAPTEPYLRWTPERLADVTAQWYTRAEASRR
jgi:glycosyltransferase involved in cell wall biosynthesis